MSHLHCFPFSQSFNVFTKDPHSSIRPKKLSTLTNTHNSRVIVFYPTSAIMTLFLNIIMYPLGPQAELDINLLSAAADLIRSMPMRKLASYEIGHMKLVNDFVAELLRLAHCAIAKAQREREQGLQDGTVA